MTGKLFTALALTSALATPAIAQRKAPTAQARVLPATSYTLPNGLKVIFHIDRSDPVVAVALTAHVGSARETPGRTGFAHMFEHLFFLDSENLGTGGLDRLSARVGGTGANGNTNTDATVYAQEFPNDALEKAIWAEADKLGFFIKTVTPAVLQKEKQVVKNEKRQSVDNRPYGHVFETLLGGLYPADHPYSWSVIGSMADLDAATLADVRDFYARWYTPGNSTLTIAGDFDPAQAKIWVERYFGELASGAKVARPTPRPTRLTASKSLMYEDSYAKLPQLTIAWPSTTTADRDQVAVELLMDLLTDGRDAPLSKLLIDELKLTDEVGGYNNDAEIAGFAGIQVRAFDGVDLDRVKAGIDDGLARFACAGVSQAALDRAKAQREIALYASLSDVDSKAQLIARREAVTGDVNFLDTELARVRALTPADIMRVYRQYIAGKPSVAVSAVPKGKPELALSGATVAKLSIEPIVQGAEAAIDPAADKVAYTRTPSRIDRTVEPAFGPAPAVRAPTIWQASAANGLALSGIEDRELPTARFALTFDGGQLFDDPAKPGAANLLARMMTRGTARRTPAELENALKALGADVQVTASRERITLTGTTLSRNFDATIALVREILLEPRWDAAELGMAKAAVTAQIADNLSNPQAIATRVTNVVSYGPASILSRDILGTQMSVAALTMNDLKKFKATRFAPANARFRVTGAVTQAAAATAIAPLATAWTTPALTVSKVVAPALADTARLYFYDVPDSKQSTLMFTNPGPARADPDYYPATTANYILGGGGFASRLTQTLREQKGYTYGIGSRFEGWSNDGRFLISSGVRANVTLEAASLVREMVGVYGKSFTDADLGLTKSFLTKSRAFAFESPADKLGMLALIGDYGLPIDYPAREAAVVNGLTVAQVRALAAKYLRPDRMTYVVVGDAATQAKRLDGFAGVVIPANELVP